MIEEIDINSFVKSVTKTVLRMRIFLLLYLHQNKELYVSEISEILKKSKATVSRHLDAMENEGVLVSSLIPNNKKVNKRYYKLSIQRLDSIIPEDLMNIAPENFNDDVYRMKFYFKIIEIMKSMKVLITTGFDIIDPFLETLENGLKHMEYKDLNKGIYKEKDFAKADDKFSKLMPMIFPDKTLYFDEVLLSKNSLKEVDLLYKEFIKKLKDLSKHSKDSGEEKSILFISSMIPLKKFLEQ